MYLTMKWWKKLGYSLLLGLILFIPLKLHADVIEVGKAQVNGTVTLEMRSRSIPPMPNCYVETRVIYSTDEPEEKAIKIAADINEKCPGRYTAYQDGNRVRVIQKYGPDAIIDFRGRNTTGETDKITMSATSYTEFLLASAPSGNPGESLKIGRDVYAAIIPTFPGKSSQQVAAEAFDSLAAHGVPDVGLSIDSLTLSMRIPAGGSFILGVHDTGLTVVTHTEALEGLPVVPSLSTYGLIALAVLLLGTATWYFRKRRSLAT